MVKMDLTITNPSNRVEPRFSETTQNRYRGGRNILILTLSGAFDPYLQGYFGRLMKSAKVILLVFSNQYRTELERLGFKLMEGYKGKGKTPYIWYFAPEVYFF